MRAVLHQPRNLGIAAAYERALDEAKLDHFSFLAGDGEIDRGLGARHPGRGGPRRHRGARTTSNPRARQLHRRFLTWASTGLVNVLVRASRCTTTRGRASTRSRWPARLPKSAGGFCFLTQMLIHALHAGHSCVEVATHPRGALPRPIEGRVDHESS